MKVLQNISNALCTRLPRLKPLSQLCGREGKPSLKVEDAYLVEDAATLLSGVWLKVIYSPLNPLLFYLK